MRRRPRKAKPASQAEPIIGFDGSFHGSPFGEFNLVPAFCPPEMETLPVQIKYEERVILFRI
jgi:hypothetical protein